MLNYNVFTHACHLPLASHCCPVFGDWLAIGYAGTAGHHLLLLHCCSHCSSTGGTSGLPGSSRQVPSTVVSTSHRLKRSQSDFLIFGGVATIRLLELILSSRSYSQSMHAPGQLLVLVPGKVPSEFPLLVRMIRRFPAIIALYTIKSN